MNLINSGKYNAVSGMPVRLGELQDLVPAGFCISQIAYCIIQKEK